MTQEALISLKHGLGTTPIHIGSDLLAKTAGLLSGLANKNAMIFIVSDDNVAPLYLKTVTQSLKEGGYQCASHVIKAGEGSKNWRVLQSITEEALKSGCERSSLVLALGGGVVGDVTGMAASLIMRGVALIHCPTSLMAQVDSAIGGKTGINTAQGKNLAGTFYQPHMVISDVKCLKTLNQREMRAGYAELVKYGLITDKNFFHWLEKNGESLINYNGEALFYAVKKGAEIKKDIVSDDVFEQTGRRALLNLGHSFGHAFEALCGYDGSLLHGEAVAVGLWAAMTFSHQLNLCKAEEVARVKNHLEAIGLLRPALHILKEKKVSGASCVNIMQFDKKTKGRQLTFILTRSIGDAFVSEGYEAMAIESFLDDFLRKI